ncbi:M23 family metallopeptidase [Spirulina sp. CS-785/01]|uniref:M23 family metallopeptidase n=1 Tax=Spirulina sp. CS-785/01 TaxID=3021716 RepID=UPI00232C0EA2|nr:M23 family metallopeptidase [Spirulina sp. CS-785/01]MDB9312083.1 M23 family metallopeptidase [Spirulina sp. CS-785/01]
MQVKLIVRSLSAGLVGFISFGVVASAIAIPFNQQINRTVDTPATEVNSRSSHSSFLWPASGQISQGFHRYHEGLDIAGPVGTPILASKGGTVVAAGWDDWGLGNAIMLQHPDGTRTVYGHNQTLLVGEGEQVQQGQIIAEMGNTGNSTGPHLHFEVYLAGDRAIDPLQVLSNVAQQSPNTRPNPTITRSQPTATGTSDQCTRPALIDQETRNFRVKICQSNGQLYYFGQSKTNPRESVWLRAWERGGRYYAENGSYTYRVKRDGIEVLRHNQFIRSEPFLN